MAQGQSRDELRILLVGKAGVGKSATGNSLLGGNLFPSRASLSSTTAEKCRKEKSRQEGREIVVLDTPGFADTKESAFTEGDVQAWIQELHPGPHVILLVLKLDRMTEEEKESIRLARKLFSGGEPFLFLLFTHKDVLDHDGITLTTFLEAADGDLKELLAAAGSRCFAINNHAQGEEKDRQVEELIGMLDGLARNNGKNRSFYSEEMFESIRKVERLEQENEELKKQVDKLTQQVKEKQEQNEDKNSADCSVGVSENLPEKLQKENEKPRKENEGPLKCFLM